MKFLFKNKLKNVVFGLILSLSLIGTNCLAATASWYGNFFHGKRTASGEVYNMHKMTAASMDYPMGTYLKVTCPSTQKSVVVKVNDRGGFKKYGRDLDLSYGAAKVLGIVDRGVAKVHIEKIHPQ